MKHTDYYKKQQELERLAEKELIAAVKAHGGSFSFFDEGVEVDNGAPIIVASNKYDEICKEHFVTRVEVDDDNELTIYGYPKFGWPDVYELFFIELGGMEIINDYIPETESVKDVSLPDEKFKTYAVFDPMLVQLLDNDTPTDEIIEYVKSQEYLGDVLKVQEFATEDEARAYYQGLYDCEGCGTYRTLMKEFDAELIDTLENL